MKSVTSRNTPIDQPDFESVQRMWDDDLTINPGALKGPATPEAPELPISAPADLSGRLRLLSNVGEIELLGQSNTLRVKIQRGSDARTLQRLLDQFAEPSSPLWSLARALSISIDLTVDGTRVAFFDAGAHTSADPNQDRPGTDRRLDADEPYGDWTYVDPSSLPDGADSGAGPSF